MHTILKHLNVPSKHYLKLCQCLQSAGGMPRLVGGVVRDALLNQPTADVDIATSLIPEKVMKILSKRRIKVIPTGIKFGTVTAFIGNEHFEITTLRKDLSCDGRHAKILYSDDYAVDAARRDFTINALSYCPFEHKIYDYFNGLEDLKNHKVKFIGSPKERINEDYLRILRFFRFSCRFVKGDLNKEALNTCSELKDKLLLLSRDRIKFEMDSILYLDNAHSILNIMHDIGILDTIFAGAQIDITLYDLMKTNAQKINVTNPISVKYAIFLKHIDDLNLSKMLYFKFSKKEAKKILDIIKLQNITSQKELNIALRKIWVHNNSYEEYFLFASIINKNYNDILKLYADLSKRTKPSFLINGHELKKYNVHGEEIGKYMQELEDKWVESDFTLSKNDLLEHVRMRVYK